MIVQLILPLNIGETYSYFVNDDLSPFIQIGVRVEVEFGKRKHYSAIVESFSNEVPTRKLKSIIQVIDEKPIISEKQIALWKWIANYYMASLGEIMNCALPAQLKLNSELRVALADSDFQIPKDCTEEEYQILEALQLRHELRISEIQAFLQKQMIMKVIQQMLKNQWIIVYDFLEEQADVPLISWIKINSQLLTNQIELNNQLNKIQKSEKQSRSILFLLQKNKLQDVWIKRSELQSGSQTESATTNQLLKKSIYEEILLSKFSSPNAQLNSTIVHLTTEQLKSYHEIKTAFLSDKHALLHGVTGSGKTLIYIKLIQETIAAGKQVLYLVPEIALTTQLILRLKDYFGENLLDYHAQQYGKNKLAIWKEVLNSYPLIIGARSSLFLPFTNLGLIIVDEEHDSSYKQNDPAPYYNARDCAYYLAKQFAANLLLGSATPSLESLQNCKENKLQLVELKNRYENTALPKIDLISLKQAQQFGQIKGSFTQSTIDKIQKTLEAKEQILIFRNRRGYSPVLKCMHCQYEECCDRCDIHLTLHKLKHRLQCHICNASKPIPTVCPECHQNSLQQIGMGTEKLEEEIALLFPTARIARMDLDTTRGRKAQQQLIERFQDHEYDILVGTQMITKGLDFDEVSLVIIVQADQMMFYPDFRSFEKTFQTITQVSGRSGRRRKQGEVLIQTHSIHHPLLNYIKENNFDQFLDKELKERAQFHYPPFTKLIVITIRHLKQQVCEQFANTLHLNLVSSLTHHRVLGPSDPYPSKAKGLYLKEILVKMEKNNQSILGIKEKVKEAIFSTKKIDGLSSVKVKINVDPL
ncbi:MAG TPA: primosomal protein N' [Saprospiraceae bacterium]|nr:primosomal protein N' [Saprospiraceae bacterium]